MRSGHDNRNWRSRSLEYAGSSLSGRHWNTCWATTANLGHITIIVVWHPTRPSTNIGLAITMWPKLVDHLYLVLRGG